MKKLIPITLICILLNFNIAKANPQVITSILNEGVYNANNITDSLGKITYIQNISANNMLYFAVLDENNSMVQTIKLKPNSHKYMLTDLEPNYKVILLGDGEAFFS